MDFDVVSNLINTTVFPIAMCVLLYFHTQKNNELHKQEIDTITKSINENTIVLTQLIDKLDMIVKERD